MRLPDGISEAEFLEATEKAVALLAHSFTFGYYGKEDIEQEARKMCWEALEGYDSSRPLAPFLYTHCRNRLVNLRRNKYQRNDPPCALCHEGRHREHEDGRICGKYRSWRKRNQTKANIMRPVRIDKVADEHELSMRDESRVELEAMTREALELIDQHLPASLRSTWLRIKAGERVTKGARAKVEAEVRAIVGAYMDLGK